MEYLGLLFEVVLLILGIWVYRFATGKIKFHSTQEPLAARFREENKGWMRICSIALMAMMSIEIVLHLLQLFNKK
jgi:hypothetical protein